MNSTRLVKISKYLSHHLRHQPQRLGLQLEPGGWVSVEKLLAACRERDFPLCRTELEAVVIQNNKQRFSFNDNQTLIRANQGHSITVDLQLEPRIPPSLLYHGTGASLVESIQQQGLLKMSRHHVHLSKDIATAYQVGTRKGKPIIFKVNAMAMDQADYTFYCSDNGVWLTDFVPPKYLSIISFDLD
ncbi:MAG: RNA 2'-phosphotransferase [Microcoleaceae cyanobacterium]